MAGVRHGEAVERADAQRVQRPALSRLDEMPRVAGDGGRAGERLAEPESRDDPAGRQVELGQPAGPRADVDLSLMHERKA